MRGGQLADAEAERERDAHGSGRNRQHRVAIARPGQMAELEVSADLEHQQHQADLTDDGDRDRRLGAKQGEGGTGEEVPEQRGAQQQAGDDLANHPRLAQAAQELITRARRADHDNELQEDIEKQSFSLMDRRMHACRLPTRAQA